MIERLEPIRKINEDGSGVEYPPSAWEIMAKINEIVDRLNEQEEERDNVKAMSSDEIIETLKEILK